MLLRYSLQLLLPSVQPDVFAQIQQTAHACPAHETAWKE